jgi:hypothetical protein
VKQCLKRDEGEAENNQDLFGVLKEIVERIAFLQWKMRINYGWSEHFSGKKLDFA